MSPSDVYVLEKQTINNHPSVFVAGAHRSARAHILSCAWTAPLLEQVYGPAYEVVGSLSHQGTG